MTDNDDDAWFAPKRSGFGTGLPIKRQGWVALIGYVLLIAAAGLLIPYSWVAHAVIVVAATSAFILLCMRKTRGGWRWRWGGKD